ncbi:MAG TPA: hypothetical protein VE288_00720 [Rubrobacteraceae bacterium]|nr:hypothetical protein [Rubrobacteraceae bacterium]
MPGRDRQEAGAAPPASDGKGSRSTTGERGTSRTTSVPSKVGIANA